VLSDRGIAPAGFVTEEVREGGRRVGFAVETFEGRRAMLAHVHFTGPPRVGRYGVDLEAFEEAALPALSRAEEGELVLIDELGKMELASAAFRSRVGEIIRSRVPFVATVHVARHPFTDAIKREADVVQVTHANREGLPEALAARLTGGP